MRMQAQANKVGQIQFSTPLQIELLKNKAYYLSLHTVCFS